MLLDKETGTLRTSDFAGEDWEENAPAADLADVLRVHDYSYVQDLKDKCDLIHDGETSIGHLDGDTAISHGTWEASLKAAGAACRAVDRVVGGENRNAFCAIRPPGELICVCFFKSLICLVEYRERERERERGWIEGKECCC